jgi:thiol:disulfide interchange protein
VNIGVICGKLLNVKTMKKLLFLIGFICSISYLQAQILDHTQESYTTSKNEVKVGETLDLIFKVEINKDWYIYSSDFKVEGPIPTTFEFTPHSSYQLVGGIQAVNPKKKYDEVWEGDITYFEKHAEYRQTVKVLNKSLKITGNFTFQTCSNVTGQCLRPETIDFTFDTKKIKVTEDTQKGNIKKEEKDNNEKSQEDKESSDSIKAENTEKTDADALATTESLNNKNDKKTKIVDTNNPQTTPENESLWGFVLLAFASGFIALATPCVFPMIPMTVTFFLKQSTSKAQGIRKAAFYGLSIMVIYSIIGILFSVLFGATFANWLSTHWTLNLFFFLLLVVFGLSFLGMFEIVLPSSWVNKADTQADKGGYYGIFFMAFVLALVSFSCTFPIAGNILILAEKGYWLKPALGMFAYSLAVAIPFTLFAVFPSWLNSLPKSGGWLNTVKVTLGFIELALSLKFLSIADQVYHWGILDRDIFLALWIVIFALLGFYFLGKIRLPHDSPSEKTSVTGLMLAMLSFAFVVYMIPGLYGAPLKPLSGYLPPSTTLDFNLYAHSTSKSPKNENGLSNVKYADFLKLPHNLEGFFDYKQGLEYAKKMNKPVFIDFTGHGCVNCREMEARVWSDAEVLKRLQNDYVVIALYIDDKKALPEPQWYKSTFDKRIKKTIGDQNADFQITKFNSNAQPFYCLLDQQGDLLGQPKSYDLDANNFITFLDKGLAEFKKRQLLAKH